MDINLLLVSHRKKREAKIKKEIKRGIREANTEDPFELFIAVTNIRYTYYKETHKILGNTYGMCVLQVWCIAIQKEISIHKISY